MPLSARNLVHVILIAGIVSEAAAGLPATAAEKPAQARPNSARTPAKSRVTPASYEVSNYAVESGSGDDIECPIDGSGLPGKRCRFDCRPQICANWYAHWNQLAYRLDSLVWKPRTYYPVRPDFSDPRDGQAYSAQGFGVPVTTPLAPVTRYSWNYSWGLPAARLTPHGLGYPLY